MDPFTTLPPEIIQQIISYVPDFVGMENLLYTSPWVKSVFLSRPRQITLDILRSNSITTVPEIQHLIYKITTLNNPSTHCRNIHNYRKLLGANCMAKGIDLPDQISVQEIFYIINLASNIQRLACMCLHTMQQNFITAVERLKTSGPTAVEQAAEPFVWIEEYRVYWALWHLHHYRILWNTAKNRWKWPKACCEDLGDNYEAHNDMCGYSYEHIWTVASILGDLGFRPFYGFSHDKSTESEGKDSEVDESHGEEPSHAAWNFSSSPNPFPFFSSLEPPWNLHASSVDFPIWSPARLPNDRSRTERYWGLTSDFRPRKLHFGSIICEYLTILEAGSIQAWQQGREDLTYIQPFRHLGVTIWSKWRMYSLGLYLPSCQNPLSAQNFAINAADGGRRYVWKPGAELSVYDAISRLLELAGKPPLAPIC